MKKAKWIGLALMCTSLVLTVIMGYTVLDRVMGLLRPAAPNRDPVAQTPSSSSSIPTVPPTSSVPTVPPTTIPPTAPSTVPPTIHQCEFIKKGNTYAPTCDALGYTVYFCECGKADYQDYVPSLGHIYGEYTTIPKTCTTDGWKERTCSRCKVVECADIEPASHEYGSWQLIAEPDIEQRDCAVCDTIQVRGRDDGVRWRIEIIHQENVGDYSQLLVWFISPDSEEDRAHYIYIGLEDPTIAFNFRDGNLLLSYTVNGETKGCAVFDLLEELTIHADGTVTQGKPKITN